MSVKMISIYSHPVLPELYLEKFQISNGSMDSNTSSLKECCVDIVQIFNVEEMVSTVSMRQVTH